MSIWSAAASWATSQFMNKFLGGGKQDSGGSFWDKAISAGASTFADKMFDTKPNKRYAMRDVNLGVTQSSTYAMSDAKGPDTPEVVNHSEIEAKWTRIAKRIAEIQQG